jgi:Protein of unknown function (DUF3102)
MTAKKLSKRNQAFVDGVKATERLKEIKQELAAEHKQILLAFKVTLDHAIRIGELLHDAKALVTYGEWKSWVEDNCKFSYRTAAAYMRVAEHQAAVKSAGACTLEGALESISRPPIEYVPAVPASRTPAILISAPAQPSTRESIHIDDVPPSEPVEPVPRSEWYPQRKEEPEPAGQKVLQFPREDKRNDNTTDPNVDPLKDEVERLKAEVERLKAEVEQLKESQMLVFEAGWRAHTPGSDWRPAWDVFRAGTTAKTGLN